MSEYEVYAVRYGEHLHRPANLNFLGADPHDGPMDMDFFVWVIKGADRTFIVDTGFDPATGVKRGRVVVRPVAQGLKAAGVDLDKVDDVIITHMHYDHVGNHDIFPNARYHLQEKEMHFCTGSCMCYQQLKRPFELDDVLAMVRRVFEGRVTFHDGSEEIAPGISVHWVGGHSAGLQVVRVRTKRGYIVLASDSSHYYANFEQQRPFPIVVDLEDMLRGYDTLHALASSPAHIIPGHDPLVMRRYPALCEGLEGVVRLDLEPEGG
ncbi:N-acyl homoserine lactonase family protein [Pseudochelatococcus sp. B33]